MDDFTLIVPPTVDARTGIDFPPVVAGNPALWVVHAVTTTNLSRIVK
jgi:hypothetical protein